MEKQGLELKRIAAGIESPDPRWIAKARQRTAELLMPTRALGRLHDIAERICGMRRTLAPAADPKAILIMAGDHGVAGQGVSAYPREVTGAMVRTFLSGGAAINVIARQVGAGVRVVDMGIAAALAPPAADAGKLVIAKIRRGTDDFTKGPAMSYPEAEKAVLTGVHEALALLDEGVDLLGTGDMGIGNTTPSAAIGAVITETDPHAVVGRGTGIDAAGLTLKRRVVRAGIERNHPDRSDGLDVLAKVGGFEIGGIAGSILAAAYRRRPVVIDGFISTAGALIAHAICPLTREYMFAGHCSEEPGHRIMLDYLGLHPLLDLNMRLGEGTGAALAMQIIEGALRVFREVSTFEAAGVPRG